MNEITVLDRVDVHGSELHGTDSPTGEPAVLTVPTAERIQIGVCPRCGKPVYKDDDRTYFDGYEYHDKCLDEITCICDDCGSLVYKSGCEKIDGRNVCFTCVSENYVECHGCGRIVRRSEATAIGGASFCEDCEENWCTCDDCGRLIRRDSGIGISGDRLICERCYDRNYFTCERCGNVFDNEECDCVDGYDYCQDCADVVRDEVFDDHKVNAYHSFPSSRYCVRRTEEEMKNGNHLKPALAYGVELECENGSFNSGDFDDWVDEDALVHFEEDGSLNSSGVEFITQPCTLLFHQEVFNWRIFLAIIAKRGFVSHNSEHCGLHIHISRRALRPTTIAKLDVFINRAGEFFSQIARRKQIYGCDGYDNDKKASTSKTFRIGSHGERYTAVNTTNSETVEIRIFRGTLKYETLIGTIEMVDALVHFLETVSIAHIYDTERNILSFVDYCGGGAEKYPHVIPMMMRLVKTGPAVVNIKRWYEKTAAKKKIGEKEEE